MLTPCPFSSYLLRKGTPMRLRLHSAGPGTSTAWPPTPLAGRTRQHTQHIRRKAGWSDTATSAPAPQQGGHTGEDLHLPETSG